MGSPDSDMRVMEPDYGQPHPRRWAPISPPDHDGRYGAAAPVSTLNISSVTIEAQAMLCVVCRCCAVVAPDWPGGFLDGVAITPPSRAWAVGYTGASTTAILRGNGAAWH